MSFVGIGFTEQIVPLLRILYYNGSIVTWTVAGLTTAKSMPLIFHCLHDELGKSVTYITTDSQSASLSWNKAPGAYDQIFYCQTIAGLWI
jgi:hypothetical protein